MQRGGRLAFVVQRELEELIERIIGLVAEAAQNASAAAVAAEQPGVERKWRFPDKTPLALLEARERSLDPHLGCRMLAQRLPQRSLALPR